MFHLDTVTVGQLNYLYHYCKVETLLHYILDNKLIRFSPLTKTNDPKETKVWKFWLGFDRDQKIDDKEFIRIQEKLSQMILGKARLCCFSVDHFDQDIEIDARGFDHPRMWSQYADNHTGVCLLLNKQKFDNQFNREFDKYSKFQGKVEYNFHQFNPAVNNSFLVNLSGDKDLEAVSSALIHEYKDVYFFKKHPDWNREYEYRYVVLDNQREYLYSDISECLQGIVFGTDTPKQYIEQVVDRVNRLNLHIDFAQIVQIGVTYHAIPLEEAIHIRKT